MSAKPTLVQLILNATAAGKSMLTAANAAAQKTLLSLVKGDVGLGDVDNTSDAGKPVSTAQQTALDAKVSTNTAITGATKTKVTYDAKGLVTAGADATTADIADSANRRYVTDAQQTVIVNTSGTNTGDQDLSSYATTSAIAAAYQPLDSDLTAIAALTTTATGRGLLTESITPSGSGALVRVTSPTLVTPVLGAATATSVNKVAVTQPATGSTLTIADGATLTASATASVSGTNTGDNAVNSLYSGLVSNATHTGDATGATALTLATVNGNVGSFGSATQTSVITVNAKGLVTAASASTVTPAVGSITGLGTGVSTFLTTPTSANLAAALTDETGSGLAVFNDNPTFVRFGLSGNISSAAWTTGGLRIAGAPGTFTDTTSSGTVAAAYTDKLGGNTIAASSVTTFTDYFTAFFVRPTAGTNVTLSNRWSIGGESAKIGSSGFTTISTTGAITTGAITLPIVDGASGQVLQTNGSGVVSWATAAGGSPGGSSGQIQYNNASAFGGANLWFSTDLIEQRNSTTAQRFRIANTWTSSTVFEQFQILAVASTGYRIGCAIGSAGGTGGASRQLDFGRWNAAGTWSSLLTWDSNDFMVINTRIQQGSQTGGDAVLQVQNTWIAQAADGSGFGMGSNAYTSGSGWSMPTGTGSTASFTTRSGVGNGSRYASLWGTYFTTLPTTSFYDWRFAAPGSTSTTSLMRLAFDGQLTLYGTKINTAASTTTWASLNVPSGTAPTSPVNGDIWSDGSDIKVRLGGVTYTLTKV